MPENLLPQEIVEQVEGGEKIDAVVNVEKKLEKEPDPSLVLRRLENQYRRLNGEIPPLSLDTIDNLIQNRETSYQMFSIYHSVLEHLRSSEDFNDLRELGLNIGVIGSSKDVEAGGRLLSPPFNILRRKSPADYRGTERGSFDGNNIVIWTDRVKASDWQSVLKEIIREEMTEEDRVVTHETVHAIQAFGSDYGDLNEGTREVLMSRFVNKKDSELFTALIEAQANLSSDYLSPLDLSSDDKLGSLRDHLVNNYNVSSDKAVYAIQKIMELKAIDCNDFEIAEMVNTDDVEFDQTGKTSSKLEEEMAVRRSSKGVSIDDDISTKYKIHCLKRKIIARKLKNFLCDKIYQEIGDEVIKRSTKKRPVPSLTLD